MNNKWKEIDGWLSDGDANILYKYAKLNNGGVIVEIGSWKGKSTVVLAMGSKDGYSNKVYAIDPHENTEAHKLFKQDSTKQIFENNLKLFGVDDIVVPIFKKSVDATKDVNNQIGLLFIDGSHEYEDVKNDINNYIPFTGIGSVILFHDYCNESGVIKAINELLCASNKFKKIENNSSIFILERIEV